MMRKALLWPSRLPRILHFVFPLDFVVSSVNRPTLTIETLALAGPLLPGVGYKGLFVWNKRPARQKLLLHNWRKEQMVAMKVPVLTCLLEFGLHLQRLHASPLPKTRHVGTQRRFLLLISFDLSLECYNSNWFYLRWSFQERTCMRGGDEFECPIGFTAAPWINPIQNGTIIVINPTELQHKYTQCRRSRNIVWEEEEIAWICRELYQITWIQKWLVIPYGFD